MKIIVIPDIHLKPIIFKKAAEHLKNNVADKAVCLMDIADDWNRENDTDLYNKTYDEAIKFAKTFPDTLWCYGNHDICYIADKRESGYSPYAAHTVVKKLAQLNDALPADNKIKYIHKVDNVVFCHGGLSNVFVKCFINDDIYNDIDKVIETINDMSMDDLWCKESPIWLRPQYDPYMMYKANELLQVVGHTPVKEPYIDRNIISCDTFSTYRNGKSIGNNKFVVIDTETWEWETIE